MSPEQRRQMIIAAALPLVAEFGAAVTTSKIARAAGIGEATIFRVFADKEELLDACLAEAVRPDHVVREIASISLDEPLEVRLNEAAEALGAHLGRMGALIGALHSSGHWFKGRGRDTDRPRGPSPSARAESMTLLRDAVTELFEPDAERIRLPVPQVAGMFLGLLFARRRPGPPGLWGHSDQSEQSGQPDQPTVEDVVALLLHGALAEAR